MKGCIIVRLEVPGVIQYRDIMLRTFVRHVQADLAGRSGA